jgi:adenylate cyclase
VGNIGPDAREQFTALGPHVNFAQRLESRAAGGQILVSASTEARIRAKFVLRRAGVVNDVKNVPGEFRLFEVVSAL